MSIVKLNCLLLKIYSFITIGYGALAILISIILGGPQNSFAGSSASRGLVGIIALYGGLVLFLCSKAKKEYGPTEQQIKKYRILTGIACALVALSIINNVILETLGVLGIIYIVYGWVAIVVNLFNTFSKRIWAGGGKQQAASLPENTDKPQPGSNTSNGAV